jgi:SWI/SNF-related matrix-associated actin-dependent regulator of chromatin subfamily A3
MYKRLVMRPLKDADPEGAALLKVRFFIKLKVGICITMCEQAIMSHVCIRRTKEVRNHEPIWLYALQLIFLVQMQDNQGNYLVPLPPVDMTVVPVALHEDVRVRLSFLPNVIWCFGL